MRIPNTEKELLELTKNLVEACNVSRGGRMTKYKEYGQWIETGRAAGGLALANLLYAHIDRLASHLFSPTHLQFNIDFEHIYPEEIQKQGMMGARTVTREWERNNIDMVFGQGVKESLAYGACIMKQLVNTTVLDNSKVFSHISAQLVMPWQFGVFNESRNELADQEAMDELVYLTKPEVWRRIAHLPDAERKYKKIIASATKESGIGIPDSMHQVLSTSQLDTSLANVTPAPGGIVTLTNDPNYATIGPEIGVDLIPMHELTVWDDARDDYTTI